MQVELSQADVELLKQALDSWEKEAASEGMLGSLMMAVMCPKEMREQARQDSERDLAEAKQKAARRRDQATLLRAKFIQTSARASEHEEVEHANH